MVDKAAGSVPSTTLQLLAEARASFSSVLSLHFLDLPDQGFVERIRSAEYGAMLQELIRDENVQPDIAQGARLMSTFLETHAGFDAERLSEALGVDRTRLYRGVSPAYGPPPPYEAVWAVSSEKVSELLREIAGIYHQDGLYQTDENPERPDYVGIELAYIEFLARDEARHIESGEIEAANQLQERQRIFLEKHLVPWVPQFVEKALEYAQTDYYRGHLHMLRGFTLEQEEIFSTMKSAAGE